MRKLLLTKLTKYDITKYGALHFRSRTKPDGLAPREYPELMQEVLASFEARLAPAENIFFTWLPRVLAAAVLVGSAWIDDAPPLGIVAALVGVYVAVRIASQTVREPPPPEPSVGASAGFATAATTREARRRQLQQRPQEGGSSPLRFT